jgi:hypothetical protein
LHLAVIQALKWLHPEPARNEGYLFPRRAYLEGLANDFPTPHATTWLTENGEEVIDQGFLDEHCPQMRIISRVRTIVRSINDSPLKLRCFQQHSELKLQSDVSHRWTSTYKMLESFLKCRGAVEAVLNVFADELPPISENDWVVIQGLIEALKSTVDTTQIVCRSDIPTLSLGCRMVMAMKNLSRRLSAIECEGNIPKTVRVVLLINKTVQVPACCSSQPILWSI